MQWKSLRTTDFNLVLTQALGIFLREAWEEGCISCCLPLCQCSCFLSPVVSAMGLMSHLKRYFYHQQHGSILFTEGASKRRLSKKCLGGKAQGTFVMILRQPCLIVQCSGPLMQSCLYYVVLGPPRVTTVGLGSCFGYTWWCLWIQG